jgi:hypothetical protein
MREDSWRRFWIAACAEKIPSYFTSLQPGNNDVAGENLLALLETQTTAVPGVPVPDVRNCRLYFKPAPTI